jgi:dihydrofolate reductase
MNLSLSWNLELLEWPYPGKPTYVLTSRPLRSSPAEVTFLDDVASALEIIRERDFTRVWIVGGARVATAFSQQDLIEEYVITVVPVILGAGISLYAAMPEQKLDLLRVTALADGMVELHYRLKPG